MRANFADRDLSALKNAMVSGSDAGSELGLKRFRDCRLAASMDALVIRSTATAKNSTIIPRMGDCDQFRQR